MARLENGSYDEIVAYLERELELNALEESDDLLMATKVPQLLRPKQPPPMGYVLMPSAITARKRPYGQRLRKTIKENEKDPQKGKPVQKKVYSEC